MLPLTAQRDRLQKEKEMKDRMIDDLRKAPAVLTEWLQFATCSPHGWPFGVVYLSGPPKKKTQCDSQIACFLFKNWRCRKVTSKELGRKIHVPWQELASSRDEQDKLFREKFEVARDLRRELQANGGIGCLHVFFVSTWVDSFVRFHLLYVSRLRSIQMLHICSFSSNTCWVKAFKRMTIVPKKCSWTFL